MRKAFEHEIQKLKDDILSLGSMVVNEIVEVSAREWREWARIR